MGGCLASSAQDDGRPPKKSNRSSDQAASVESSKDYEEKMAFITKVPLMKRLPFDQHPIVAAAFVATQFKKGDTVIKQGDHGDEFFMLRSGQAQVLVNNEQVLILQQGDYFGESALLRDEPRSATVVAHTDLSTYQISRAKFQDLGLNTKLHFVHRKAVFGGVAIEPAKVPKDSLIKTQEDIKLIMDALNRNDNLQTMATLDQAKIQALVDVAWKQAVAKDERLIREGDLDANYFYIVAEGTFEILLSDDNPMSKLGKQVVSEVGRGGSFGELALLYLVPRAATVKCVAPGLVWVIERAHFKRILMQSSDKKIKQYLTYLDRAEILNPLLAEEKLALAQALIEMHFKEGELIVKQGEPGNTFYILYDGIVDVIKDGDVVNTIEASKSQKSSKTFGEGALLSRQERLATVKVTSALARALVLDRDSFDMLLGPLKELMDQRQKGRRVSMTKAQCELTPSVEMGRIKLKDLLWVGLLGCGGFGAVELYEHKKTTDTYALKSLSKGYIVKTKMQDGVKNEKRILMMTNSPFIIKLYETYNGSQKIHFLLEVALGGELYATYNRKDMHGSKKFAQFYAAGVTFAFEHLHERHIIYRDLKPENIMLCERGHPKLTDMGLAKFVIGKTFSTCGTSDYFAPEVIATTGHTIAVDWWTLGILIFELMSGHPPFESSTPMETYNKVKRGIHKVPMPSQCQGSVGGLIAGLLAADPSERLPMKAGGVSNLKGHKWFAGFDWEQAFERTMVPPYRPAVSSKKDISNFFTSREEMPCQLEYHDDGSGWDKDFATM